MSAFHVVVTYSAPMLCMVVRPSFECCTEYSFRRILGCCWRESVACLQFYCHTLPMAYMIDQRKILFWKKIQVVRTQAILSKGSIGVMLS